ncbi:MAG: 6-phosphofructokinase, partial [Hydrogenovibrio crunogenus]|nr:6-phosphofructokinase [Hydrogenovibrio crunogenus]
GKAAVQAALDGHHGVLPTIDVISQSPLVWRYQNVDLYQVAELEKRVPDAFLTEDGMDITQEAIEYLQPLIKGERPVKFHNGLPDIAPIHFDLVPPTLSAYKAIK